MRAWFSRLLCRIGGHDLTVRRVRGLYMVTCVRCEKVLAYWPARSK